MSDNNEFGSFLSGFLIGGLVGAAVALLMAPQSGEETRTLIYDKGVELKDKTTASLEETYAKAEKAAADARQRAEELAKEAQARAEELRQRGQVILEEQRSKLSEKVQPKEEKKPAAKKTGTKKADAK